MVEQRINYEMSIKVLIEPMNNPLSVGPSKGNQGTTRCKEKKYFDLCGNRTHDLWIRSTVTLLTELRGRTEKVRDDLGGESRRRGWRKMEKIDTDCKQ